MSKEDKVKEYIRKIFNCKDCIFYKDCMYGIGNNDVKEYNCMAQEEAESFKAGWDEAILCIKKSANIKIAEADEYARKKITDAYGEVVLNYAQTIGKMLKNE